MTYCGVKWSVIIHCCRNVRCYGNGDFPCSSRLHRWFLQYDFKLNWWNRTGLFFVMSDQTLQCYNSSVFPPVMTVPLLSNRCGALLVTCVCVWARACTHVHMHVHMSMDACASNWPIYRRYDFRFIKQRKMCEDLNPLALGIQKGQERLGH